MLPRFFDSALLSFWCFVYDDEMKSLSFWVIINPLEGFFFVCYFELFLGFPPFALLGLLRLVIACFALSLNESASMVLDVAALCLLSYCFSCVSLWLVC